MVRMLFILLLLPNFSTAGIINATSFKGVNPQTNELYESSCGECHFAYFPGLLVAKSWETLMLPNMLEDHFGENAELDSEDYLIVRKFLVENSAEKSIYKRSRKISHSIRNMSSTPIRITNVSYIKRKHSGIKEAMIRLNPDVRSLINCNSCHLSINKGIFDDDDVKIPNFGWWSNIDD